MDQIEHKPIAKTLLAAGRALETYVELTRAHGRVMPQSAIQGMFDAAIRHIKLFDSVGGQLLPKHHLWLHMIAQTSYLGNPRCRSTYQNESLNGIVARMCHSCHRATFCISTLQKYDLLQTCDGDLCAGSWVH